MDNHPDTSEDENKQTLKIGVVGLGAVGMILAVKLQQAGFDVAVCDTDRVRINQIRRDGIQLQGVLEEHCKFDHVFTDIRDFHKIDPELIIFSVKSHQMQNVLSNATKFIEGETLVISAQNGLDVEKILSNVFGEDRTLRIVINFAGNIIRPNTAKVNFVHPPSYIASMDDSKREIADRIANALTKEDLEMSSLGAFELIPKVWEKTILNSSLSALCGIGKMTIRQAMDLPDTVEIVEQVIAEAVEVAEAEKVRFDDDFIRKCLRYLRKAGDHFPSLAVDLMNNCPTEIDYQNGKIVEYGRKHYLRTSLNLVFTNMVKAMTANNLKSQIGLSSSSLNINGDSGPNVFKIKHPSTEKPVGDCFLGIDLGSAYTKLVVVDSNQKIVYQTLLKTLNRRRFAIHHVIDAIHEEFPIKYCCATGYGRKSFPKANIDKTEINCAAVGAAEYLSGEKCIIDIGGEDIKIIRCDKANRVESFSLNDKCAAGTGAFITEVAERADINFKEMSALAAGSNFSRELNSFCTVFAKTEIMAWQFDGICIEDICRGMYLSIINRVGKMRVDLTVPVLMIGGVVAHHPFLAELLGEKFKVSVEIMPGSQHIAALGAALIAKEQYKKQHLEADKLLSTN